ncbi:aromatic ring-hydroxylating oxygenase subunit alpha [Shewanella surugensis]|uniref:Aromatic ring-hydroxylating dioxygenase subunit alpha n=1 Tax=Shewanella surugensis TaxID=212020 RepID=A0ABT0L7Q6_9GAMM|nr:aromatic ring-hydroxylating dioxygenase subunit alpha [Shewanella surugensis]MCL1123430.1 aromatic ring-hydroxylating dioxygenase subunit alpha [Shewanella surugensis]
MNTYPSQDHWFPVTQVRKLKKNKPLAVAYYGQSVVLFRDGNKIHALKDQCPHRGVPLSTGCLKQGALECPYHGWTFNGQGQLTSIPGDPHFRAPKHAFIDTYAVCEAHGLIWLSLNQVKHNPPFIPQVHASHIYSTQTGIIEANCVDIAENFLDALHTHTVHTGIIRNNSPKRHACHATITHHANGYQAEYIEEKKQTGLVSRLFGSHIIKGIGRIHASGILELEYYSKKGIALSVVIYLVPETDKKTKLIVRTYAFGHHYLNYLKMWAMFPFQYIAFIQDKRILETQQNALNNNADFKPMITGTDLMRPYIIKAFQNDIQPTHREKQLLL